MIEKMLKYSMLIHHADYEAILNKLYELGIVHIVTKKSIANDDKIAKHLRYIGRFKNEIRFLETIIQRNKLKAQEAEGVDADGISLLKQIEELREKKNRLLQDKSVLSNERARISVWGEFEREDIKRLEDAGYAVGFYTCLTRDFDSKWIDQYNILEVNEKSGSLYFITVTPTDVKIEISAERFKFGVLSLREIDIKLKDTIEALVDLDLEIERFAVENIALLRAGLNRQEELLNFDTVRLSTDKAADDKIMLIEAWVPEVKAKQVDEFLENDSIYCIIEEPKDNDNVPILLRSNKFAKMFEIIGGLYDLPRYGTIDLTPFFAPFYVIFFGFCFADAGYGALMVLAALAAKFFMKNKTESTKNLLNLVMVLGFGTVFWGLITGNIFGIELLKFDWGQANKFRDYILVPDQLFPLSLAIGVVQIVYGMIIKSVFTTLRKGIKHSLGSWGWTIGIGGAAIWFMLTKFGVLFGTTADYVMYGIIGVAGFLVLFFNAPDKPIYLNPIFALKEAYDMATGLLGDVLSYVRLFALSISGAVMGIVFNQLAMEMSGDIPVLSIIFMVIMLAIGHGMNIFMSGLGSFIHPMRLTFVEFYKNAGFEGGGKPYQPFKKKEI